MGGKSNEETIRILFFNQFTLKQSQIKTLIKQTRKPKHHLERNPACQKIHKKEKKLIDVTLIAILRFKKARRQILTTKL